MLTNDQINAIAVPAGWAPGPTPATIDPQEVVENSGGHITPEVYRERARSLGERLVTAAGDRHGWSPEQRAAALDAYWRTPIHAVRGGRMTGSRTYEVLVAAAGAV